MATLKSIIAAFLIFVFAWNNSQAQIPSKIDANWVFPNNHQLMFNGFYPDTVSGSQLNSMGYRSASASDDSGNLLFYTNSINVWNADNVIMPWSHDSCPSGNLYHYIVSGHYSRVSIAHVPLQLEKYYIFTFKEHGNTGELDAYYTEVDMSLNNGMGDVNPFKKNVFFKQNVLGDLYMANHRNGYDQWIILHKSGTDSLFSYLLTENGFMPPVISKTGPIITTSLTDFQPGGFKNEYCKTSPDGKFLLYTRDIMYLTQLYSFDDSTGRVIHIMDFDSTTFSNGLHPAFSPNSQYIYANNIGQGPLYKIDISSGIPSQIVSSVISISTNLLHYQWMRPAIDGKIYFRCDSYNGHNVVGRFDFPDTTGSAIGIQDSLIGNNRLIGLFPKRALDWYWNIAGFDYDGICLGDTTFFETSRPEVYLDSVKYNFGDVSSGALNFSEDINPSHFYSQPGVYDVQVITYRKNLPDTSVISIDIFPHPISQLQQDTSFCMGSEITLSAGITNTNSQYLWDGQPGLSTYTLTPQDTAFCYLEIIDSTSCSTKDSILLMPYPLQANFEIEPAYCPDQELDLVYLGNADSTADYYWTYTGANYLSGSGQGPVLISYPTAGNYETSLHIMQGQCISDTFTLAVNIPDFPEIESELIHPVCYGYSTGSIQIDTSGSSGNWNYLWSNGDTNSAIDNLCSGWYYLNLSYQGNCQIVDSFLIVQPDMILVSSVLTDVVGIGNSNGMIQVFVSGGTPDYIYQWNTGDTISSLDNLVAGNYYLTVTDENDCQWDTVFTINEYASVNQPDSRKVITIYPNPGNEKIIIELKAIQPDLVFQLLDIQGKLMLQKEINQFINTVNTSELNAGTYTFTLKIQDEIIESGKWVKQ